jgi:hypothetical protein
VVADVAPPQEPVGAALTAVARSPLYGVQVIEGVRTIAVPQLACPQTMLGTANNKMRERLKVRRILIAGC